MSKVFLGGTCNGSTWRDNLIKKLEIDYFNPVVEDWTPECQTEEIIQRATCDYCLYVITPKLTGVLAIAEVVDDSNKRHNKTIFCFLDSDEGLTWEKHQTKSLLQVGKMIEENGAKWCKDLDEVAEYLNKET
jgi:hypothetical protein